jgi:hypothetical protein
MKRKTVTMHAIKAYRGLKVWLHVFLIYLPDLSEWPASRSGRFTHCNNAPSIHSLQGSVDPRPDIQTGEKENLLLYRESIMGSSNIHPDA